MTSGWRIEAIDREELRGLAAATRIDRLENGMTGRLPRTVAVLSMFTGFAWAQDTGPGGAMFQLADGNGDGFVTREEVLAARTREFEVLDRTRDGYLDDADRPPLPPLPTLPPLPGAPGGQGAAGAQGPAGEPNLTTPIDADKDGKVSKAEFIDGGTRLFERADANHDGKLDRQESSLPNPPTAPPLQP